MKFTDKFPKIIEGFEKFRTQLDSDRHSLSRRPDSLTIDLAWHEGKLDWLYTTDQEQVYRFEQYEELIRVPYDIDQGNLLIILQQTWQGIYQEICQFKHFYLIEEDKHYGLCKFNLGKHHSYGIALNEREAFLATQCCLLTSLCVIDPKFLAQHSILSAEAIKAIQKAMFEQANDDIFATMRNYDYFVYKAIEKYGYGYWLSGDNVNHGLSFLLAEDQALIVDLFSDEDLFGDRLNDPEDIRIFIA